MVSGSWKTWSSAPLQQAEHNGVTLRHIAQKSRDGYLEESLGLGGAHSRPGLIVLFHGLAKGGVEGIGCFLELLLGRDVVVQRQPIDAENKPELDRLVPAALATQDIDEAGDAARVHGARDGSVVDPRQPRHQQLQRIRHLRDVEGVEVAVVADVIFHRQCLGGPHSFDAPAPNHHVLTRCPLMRVCAIECRFRSCRKPRVPSIQPRAVQELTELLIGRELVGDEFREVGAFAIHHPAPHSFYALFPVLHVRHHAARLRTAHHGNAHHLFQD